MGKTFLKIVEVICWFPFIVIGMISKLIFQGLIGGWFLMQRIHEWMDNKIKFSELFDYKQ